MKKIAVTILLAASLGGCVHNLPKPVTPQHHHVAKPVPKAAVVIPAPIPTITPSPKQTFRRRWLHLFFRDRAVAK